MEKPSEYIGLLVMFIFSAGIAGVMLLLTSILGPKKPSAVKSEPFECGVEPFDQPKKQFSIKFYLIAMLFILFDVEIVWLFPWAVVLKTLGVSGILGMFSFMAVLVLGFVYAWKKGALEWEK